MKLKDNPGRTISSGDLLQPNGVDSMAITPLYDGIVTMVFTPHRPYYLRGEDESKLNVEMICYSSDNKIIDQFNTSIPVSKIIATENQKLKTDTILTYKLNIDPQLDCKGKETIVKFTATTPGTAIAPDEYLSVSTSDSNFPFYYNRVYLKDILQEINQNLKGDNKFRVLYYWSVVISLLPIILFSLFETKKIE